MAAGIDLVNELSLELDGHPLDDPFRYRAGVGEFSLLDPLEPGLHDLRFGGTSSYGFTVDVTYQLNVE